MATEILRPNGVGNYSELTPIGDTPNWKCVDETSSDGDSTYNRIRGSITARDSYTLSNPVDIQAGDTINSVTVHHLARAHVSSSVNHHVRPFIRLGSTDNDGTIITDPGNTYTERSETLSRPGGGSWTLTDLQNLEAGAELKAVLFSEMRLTIVWVVVDYTPAAGGNHPSPTNLELDFQSGVVSNASEYPNFTAIFEATGGSGTATHAYVQVAPTTNYTSPVWDSGWIDITDVTHGNRCEVIEYAGNALESNKTYYWRIKFKDGSSTESDWSANGQFSGVVREWWDRDYAFRRKLTLDPDHPTIGNDYTLKFDIQTGVREPIADNGCFNEAIQEAGYMIEQFGHETYVVYLSRTELIEGTAQYGIYFMARDHITGQWSDPELIDDAHTYFDTHNYPTLVVDQQGYIVVCYGAHGGLYYVARRTPTSQGGVWTVLGTPGPSGTYPQLFLTNDNRINLISRAGTQTQVWLWYSDDRGSTWTGRKVLEHSGAGAYRLYCYGVRFDKVNERLHLGFSYIDTGNITQGVYYCYSDYDDEAADGFVTWHKADGTQCGTTSTDPVNKGDADEIVLNEPNDRIIYFCRNITLTKDGKPIVFFSFAWDLDIWGQEASFGVGTWNGSSWDTQLVSEQLRLKARTDRCGIPGLADRDGVIHNFTVMDSVTRAYLMPAADVTNVNATAVGGAGGGVYYDVVDDGLEWYEVADYIDVGQGEVSFSSNESLNPGIRKVLSVGVHVIWRCTSVNTSQNKLFLTINSTDYESTTFSRSASGNFIEDVYWWDQNPDTSSDWTASEVESLIFGVKQTAVDANMRLARVIIMAKVRYSTDDEQFASELIELFSDDDGATWSYRRLSENSEIGVPILSIKHHYTNNQIELVWTSGYKLYYLQSGSFGKIRKDARDLRIIHQAGSTKNELHRVLDNANSLTSTVRFKCPESLAASVINGAKDLFAYYGNPNVSDDPLSDPNSVYLYFEGFETFEDDDNIHGIDGWSVVSGQGVIWASPPEHNNKVYAGAKSLDTVSSTPAIIERTLGSGLSDIIVECALWNEGGSRCWVNLLDASSNEFQVGINDSSDRIEYDLGSGFVNSSVPATRAAMFLVKLQVTASGCSAWSSDQLALEEGSAITSVDKLSLETNGRSYFDNIKVYRKYRRTKSTTVSSGFTDNNISLNAIHTAAYDASPDGKHDSSQYDVYRVDVKVRVRLNDSAFGVSADVDCWIASGSTYNGANAKDNETHNYPNLSQGVWQSYTFVFDNGGVGLDLDNYSIKVDYYQRSSSVDIDVEIEEVKYYYWERDPVIIVGDEEVSGLLVSAAIQGKGGDQVSVKAAISGFLGRKLHTIPAEHTGLDSSEKSTPVESTQAGLRDRETPTEFLSTSDIDKQSPIDFIRVSQRDKSLPVDSIATLQMSPRTEIEFTSQREQSARAMIEYLLHSVTDKALPVDYEGVLQRFFSSAIEYLQEASLDGEFPIEFAKNVAGDQRIELEYNSINELAAQIPVDWRSMLTLTKRTPVEHRLELLRSLSTAIEYLYQFQQDLPLEIEFTSTRVKGTSIPVSWRGSLQIEKDSFIPIEFTGSAVVNRALPVESTREAEGVGGYIPISFVGSFSVQHRAVIDWVGSSELTQQFMVEALSTLRRDLSGLIEFLQEKSKDVEQPIEFSRVLEAVKSIPIEYRGTAQQEIVRSIPVEWRLLMTADRRMQVDHLSGGVVDLLHPVSYSMTQFKEDTIPVDVKSQIAAIMSQLSIEFTSRLTRVSSIPIEKSMIGVSEFSAAIDFLQTVLRDFRIPIEWEGIGVTEFTYSLPVSWRGTYLRNYLLPVDHQSSFSRTDSFMVEWLRKEDTDQELQVEFGKAIQQSAQILAEWTSLRHVTGTMQVDFTSQKRASIAVQIEYNRGLITESVISIEWLRELLQEYEIPIEFAGLLITLIALTNVRLEVPGLMGSSIDLPGLAGAMLNSAGVSSAGIDTTGLSGSALKVAKLINEQLIK